MESKPVVEDDAKSTVSKARSVAKSGVAASSRSNKPAEQTEEEKNEAYLKSVRDKYQPIIDNNSVRYKPKMVGLNPNMRPRACDSQSKIFPMQGLWTSKQLMKTSRDIYTVPFEEQVHECKTKDKDNNKKMYEQKEYMEEYLKFKEVIAGMKK